MANINRNNSNSSSKAKSNSFSAASRCTTSPSRKLARSFHPDTHIPIEPLDIYDPDLMIDERGSVMGGTPQKLLELTTNVSFQGKNLFYDHHTNLRKEMNRFLLYISIPLCL